MKNNDMSFESLYSAGLGLSSEALASPSIQSFEGYDGYEDGITMDLQHSIESLEFLDTYAKVESSLADTKIRMCKRLSVNYGLKSGLNATAANSVESLCTMQSLEAKADKEAVDGASEKRPMEKQEYNNIKSKFNDAKGGKKGFKAFMKGIWAAIKAIFRNIGIMINNLIVRIRDFFKSKFKKATRNATKEEQDTAKEEMKTKNKDTQIYICGGSINVSEITKDISIFEEIGKNLSDYGSNIENGFIKKFDIEEKKGGEGVGNDYYLSKNDPLTPIITKMKPIETKYLNLVSAAKKDNTNDLTLKDVFGIKITSDPKDSKIIDWASQANNINKLQSDIESLEPRVKKIANLANKCEQTAKRIEDSIEKQVENDIKDGKNTTPGEALIKKLSERFRAFSKLCVTFSKHFTKLAMVFKSSYNIYVHMTKTKTNEDGSKDYSYYMDKHKKEQERKQAKQNK